MTQPPKVRKTPITTPSSQSLAKRSTSDSESPRTSLKTINQDAPIVIGDNDFGDMLDNDNLIQVLSSVEEKNGNGVHHKEPAVVVNAAEPIAAEKPKETPQPRRNKKEKKISELQSDYSGAGDETSSSVRTSVDSSVTVHSGGDDTPLEMGSLLIPDDDELVASKSVSSNVDSPRPINKTPGGTKIVRLTKGMRLSPFRKVNGEQPSSQPLDNISTIVNLSTVSEQSVENNLDSPSAAAAITPKNGIEKGGEGVEEEDGTVSTGSSRVRISARRTFSTNRPLREMSFRNSTREAYRKIGEDGEEDGAPATVNDSVNATVGSELGLHLDDLPETPAAGVGQKRRRNQDEDGSEVDDDEDEGAPEPKKSFLQTYCVLM